jgi:hypothetical protein
MELVVYDNVEVVTKRYLDAHLGDGTKVATKMPNPRPANDRFVKLEAAGGSDRTMVTSTRLVVVQCWDRDPVKAAALAERCFAILHAARRDPASGVRHVATVSAPQSFPDPDTGIPRYQFAVALDLRGAVS